MKARRILLSVLLLFCLAGAGFCGWNLYKELAVLVQAEQVYKEVRRFAYPAVEEDSDSDAAEPDAQRARPDFASLLAWNGDVVGWILSEGTDINYPIVQGQDNVYYLNHTADGGSSVIGSIFMESKNRSDFRDDVTVLYGHHIRGGRMFSSLSGYKSQSYYEEHPVMILYTPEKDYIVELFAGQIIDGQTGTFPLVFGGVEEQKLWLETLLSISTFRSPVTVAETDRILALCTCSYEYQDARYVVYGVLKDMEEGHE